ncbi:hypothetical protein U1Q18_028584, partial [Sarracenia purpurea var. burkii]
IRHRRTVRTTELPSEVENGFSFSEVAAMAVAAVALGYTFVIYEIELTKVICRCGGIRSGGQVTCFKIVLMYLVTLEGQEYS